MAGRGFAYYAGLFLALLLIAIAGYFVYLLMVTSDQTRLAVLTAAVSIGTIVYTQTKNSKREIEGRQFAKKAEAYEEIITAISDLMQVSRAGESPDNAAFVQRLSKILPKLMIWAGPDVLNAWKQLSSPESEGELNALIAGNALIAALRKELGHRSDDTLGPLGLVAVFIRGDERHKLGSMMVEPREDS